MSEKEIMNQNNMIAQFMNLKISDNGKLYLYKKDWRSPVGLGYHKYWNDLMPVVEKIESIWINGAQSRCKIEGIFVEIVHEVGYHNIDFARNSNIPKDNQIGGSCYTNSASKIENTYKIVIQFINWYNINNNK